MSVYREKEQPFWQEKKLRDSSISRNPKRSESKDGRPIITQEKPATSKLSSSNPKEKRKSQTEKIMLEKPVKKKTDVYDNIKRDRRTAEKDLKALKQSTGPFKVKRHESMEPKNGREYKSIATHAKDLREKKGTIKPERNVKEKTAEKLPKGFCENVTSKKKEDEEKRPKTRRDRTRTRTLSPTEIKQLIPPKMAYELASGDANADRERKKKEEEVSKNESEEEYEDDFEDYDSDFEDDSDSKESLGSSTSHAAQATSIETDKPKSLNFEDQWKLSIRKKELEAVKKSIEKENRDLLERRKLVEDESNKENSFPKKSTYGLIGFPSASNPQKNMKIRMKETYGSISVKYDEKRLQKAAARRKRGEELLSMISLDTVSYSILEIPPISYDDFMKVFGKSHTKQVYVQTNEDDLDEEVQTDQIQVSNKWTQNPSEYLGRRQTGSQTSFILTKEERLGVGGDDPLEEEVMIPLKTKALWNFLSWASQLILIALEKKSGDFLSMEKMPNHSKAMVFGDGFVNLNVIEIPFLKGRSVTHLCLLSKSEGRLLSVHANKDKFFQKCMICIWSLRELSKPLKVLMASNRVTSCCFGLNQGNLVFAGLSDGRKKVKRTVYVRSMCLWDLREPSAFHNRMTNNPEWSLQSPTYTTAGNFEDSGHSSPVVAVRLLSRVEASSGFGDFTPMQICSLDKNGTTIIWTVVQLEKIQRNTPSDDLGLAHWGRVKLVKSSSFSVFAGLREEIPGLYITCNDLLVNEREGDGLYVANSFGSVHHCSSYGSPMKPKFYVPSKQDSIIETTCLELCPFNGNYFLVGCYDGTIRLHSRHQENPLICLNSSAAENEKEAPVVSLSWMRMRPCVFFALDSMSRINIWDLGVSDIYPEISLVLTEKKITCMRLLSVSDPRQVPFIVIGTEGGSIEIHKLKKEYGCRTVSDVQNEMKMFLKYVSIL